MDKKGLISFPAVVLLTFAGITLIIALVLFNFSFFQPENLILPSPNKTSCTEFDWTFKYEPANCPPSETQKKVWSVLGQCEGGVTHLSSEEVSCDYKAPICTSFTYSVWGECSSSGVQTRTITGSIPNNCLGGNPIVSQACGYIPLCSEYDWSYSAYPTNCPLSERQIRNWTKIGNCEGGITNPSSEKVSCDYETSSCTSFTYSSWGECSQSGVQTRSIIRANPRNCVGGNPLTSRACAYIPLCSGNDWNSTLSPASCPASGLQEKTWTKIGNCEGGVTHPTSEEVSCDYNAPSCASFTYSSWGECSQSGTQSRNILTSSPSDCVGGNPLTSQTCTYVSQISQSSTSGRKLTISAQNTLNDPLINQVMITSISLADNLLHSNEVGDIVLDQKDKSPLFVYALPSSLELYPSGFVKSMKIAFRDSFSASEIKEYMLKSDKALFRQVLESSQKSSPNFAKRSYPLGVSLVNEQTSEYKIFNELGEYNLRHLKDSNVNGGNSILDLWNGKWGYIIQHPIVGNKNGAADSDNLIFNLGIGSPTEVSSIETSSMASISFKYKNPIIHKNAKNTLLANDFLEASSTIIVFQGDPKIYIDSTTVIKQDFYNHNGFIDGAAFTSTAGGDVILGTDEDLSLSNDFSGNRDPFMGLQDSWPEKSVNGKLVPAIFAVNNDKHNAKLAISNSKNKFNDYYVIKSGNEGVLFYIPDYQRIVQSKFGGYYQDSHKVSIPKAQLLRSGVNSKTYAAQIFSSSGPGEGWIPLLIPAGTYKRTTVIIPNQTYKISLLGYHREGYDQNVSMLNAVKVEVKPVI